MKRLAISLSLTCILAACGTPDVKYADLSPRTFATDLGTEVIIHLGSDLANSACWTHARATVKGQTVFVTGYHTLHEESRTFAVRLPPGTNPHSVTVVWVDPDGTRVPVPLRK